ncbi:UBA domain-containing protein [Durusdinium trenchii]|uniref:UBA domain-containing protein n=1 Tax=Durusdinium trenchii TaxID=1381693 RepID=A0ABP0QLA7_9DINO
MSKPSDMPYEERKRQYAAMRRQIYREAPPALLAKYSLAPDAERFQMLRQWMLNPDLDSIFVEEKYVQWTESLRSDRYTTVTLFQLEKLYGKSKEAKEFIKELIKGDLSLSLSGAPTSTKGRMFKVLKEVVEENSQGNRTDKLASVGGRCRDEGAKKLLAQQLGGLQDPEFLNMATGQIKSKKMPKQKTPEQISQFDLKALQKKLKGLINTIPAILNDIKEYKVRNCAELVSWSDSDLGHQKPVNEYYETVTAKEVNTFVAQMKENIKDVENDVKDGFRLRILEEGVILCRFLKGVCLSIAESYPQDTHAALLGCFRHFRHKWHFF